MKAKPQRRKSLRPARNANSWCIAAQSKLLLPFFHHDLGFSTDNSRPAPPPHLPTTDVRKQLGQSPPKNMRSRVALSCRLSRGAARPEVQARAQRAVGCRDGIRGHLGASVRVDGVAGPSGLGEFSLKPRKPLGRGSGKERWCRAEGNEGRGRVSE